MMHYVSEYIFNEGFQFARVVGTFLDKSDAENASKFFGRLQGDDLYSYWAESKPGQLADILNGKTDNESENR